MKVLLNNTRQSIDLSLEGICTCVTGGDSTVVYRDTTTLLYDTTTIIHDTTTILRDVTNITGDYTGVSDFNIEIAEMDGSPLGTVSKIVFNGDTETVTIIGDVAYINRPGYLYSLFNNSDGASSCVPYNTGTSNWWVADPDGTFDVGDWNLSTTKPCLISNFTLSHSNKAREIENKTVTCNVYNSSGTLLATNSLLVTGNGSLSSEGISITISGWELDVDVYAGLITCVLDTDVILGGGSGRIQTELIVEDAVPYIPNDIFHDANSNTCQVNSTPSITETAGSVITRFISGVEGYYIGSEFTVGIDDIINPNSDTYRNNDIITILGSEYSLSSINVPTSALTGWNNIYDLSTCSYFKDDWILNSSNVFTITTSANISARGRDPWSSQVYVNSINNNIIINTYSQVSSAYYEDFRDEVWRLPIGDYDTPLGILSGDWQNLWNSESHLGSGDLQCAYSSGWKLVYPSIDYTLYNPNAASQPNYNSSLGIRYFLRSFYHNSSNAVQGSIYLNGISKTELESSGLIVEIKVPFKTGWMKLNDEFNLGTWTGSDGDGIWQNKSAQNDYWFDFGWKAAAALDSSCGWAIVVKITAIDNTIPLPTSLSIQFDVQEHS